MILIEKTLHFLDGSGHRGNFVQEPPPYLKSVFEDEHSPIRTYLETIEPNAQVQIAISVMVKR